MENHSDLFPQLNETEDVLVSKQQLLSLSYFKEAERFVQTKDIDSCIANMKKHFKKISVKRGTVLYFSGQQANRCYFLKRGCLQVLTRKNNKQKLQMFPNHNIASTNEKINFLFQKYGIQRSKAEQLLDDFYQEKILFKFLNFRTLYGEGEVGVTELFRNSFRVFTVIATSESQLLALDKQSFDKCLRQFQKKKQASIIETLLINFNSSVLQQLKFKFGQVMLTSMIKLMDTDQILFRQNSAARFFYYVIDGQFQLVKSAQLEIPKKYQISDDKANPKQIELKIHKTGRYSFLGEQALVPGRKIYNFTAKCCSNSTMIIRIEPISFIKALSENSQVQADFKESSAKKIQLAVQSFDKQLKKIRRAFQQQFQDADNKKKQLLICNFLKNDTYTKTRLFEVFNDDHSLFYRDTFEKLEVLNEQSPTQIKSKAKSKIRATGMMTNSPQKQKFNPQTELQFDNEKKMGMSLTTAFRQTDFLMRSSTSLNRNTKSSMKSARLLHNIDKFRQIKKDENTYKKVMIMQGRYEVDRNIDHSKNVKAIVNRNFDEIVKKAITRKNPMIRRVGEQRRQDLYREYYQKTINNLNKLSSSSAPKLWFAQSPCKGVQQMKKKMKKINTIREQQSSRYPTNIKQNILQDCIGVNELPRSRSTNRFYAETSKFSMKPQKIVLLNHMMKPMTYTSFQS